MNQKNFEKLIPIALDVLNNDEEIKRNLINEDNSIDSTYFSYIDSFVPAARLSGLLLTLQYYKTHKPKTSNTEDNNPNPSKHSREKIYYLFSLVLKKSELLPGLSNDNDIYDFYNANRSDSVKKIIIRNRLVETATACKYAIKSFEKKSDKEDEG
ncbi:MAG: hypothetical protein AB1521_04460 [Bacteroidota bacterium]